MKIQSAHLTHRGAIVGTALFLLLLAGGTSWWTWQSTRSTDGNQPPASTQIKPTQTVQPQIYWLRVEEQRISLIPQQVALNGALSPEQALMEGVIHLLSNSGADGQKSSAIPKGTRLLGLQVAPGSIYVNLSREFGQGGGSSSMIYRVAQILYTVTSLDPEAKVYFSVEGQPLDENHPLGGEGLLLRYPLTRQQFAEDVPLS